MVIERAEIEVVAGQEESFAAVMADKGIALLSGVPGCASVTMGRGIENPSKFILLLHWGAVEEHIAFTQTPEFAEFGGLVGGFFAGPPAMEHFAPAG